MTSTSRQSGQPNGGARLRPGQTGASFRLKTLGHAALLRVIPGGDVVEVLGPGKPFAVVAYLACSPGRSASRERLIDLLWANLDLDAARHGLRQALWYLRKQLGPDCITTRDQEVVLSAPVDSDRDRFLEAIERRELERAVELYEGEFLPMFAAPGGADFEAWGDMERFRLRAHFLDAAEAVAWDRLDRGDPEGAKEVAFQMRNIHPVAQRSWRLLLEVLLAANDPVTARIEAEALERRLEMEELSADPATRKALEAARDPQRHTPAEKTDSSLRPELIAREREFARILAAWRSAEQGRGRHIHIRGSAGLGKTRLVAEVAGRLGTMGAQVVQVRAAPGRRELSYALISEMAGELSKLPGAERISEGAASVLVALNPSLSDLFSARPIRAQEADVPRQRDMAMTELVAAVSVQAPVALFIDDTHWTDDRSRQLLHSLCERAPEHRLLLVTAGRPTGAAGGLGDHTENLSLEPLPADAVSALVASLGSLPETEWAERFPKRLCESASGSPLLVLETLRFALERGLLALEGGRWSCPDPGKLQVELSRGGALRRRVSGLLETERRLLLVLCVAGTPVSAKTIARTVQRGTDEVTRELQTMEVRGLVAANGTAWAPAHDEIGAAAVGSVDPDQLRWANDALGRTLLEAADGVSDRPMGDALLRSVRHLHAAGGERDVGPVYDRWIRSVRRSGDRRSLRILAKEVVGDESDGAAIRRLTRSLPLSTRLGLSYSGPRRKALAVTAIAALVWATAQMAAPGPPPPDGTLIVLRPGPGDEVTGYEIPIRREGWENLQAIDITRAGRRIPELTGVPVYGGALRQAPGGGRWAYAGVTEESWAPDLFLVEADGTRERMSRHPGDDAPMTWSPDGRYLLVQTGRWNPNYWQDLAVLDLETGEFQPLVQSNDSHGTARWSPDGTRVLFRRHRVAADLTDVESLPDDPRQVCWTSVDARVERCLDHDLAEIQPVGWADTERVLVRGVDSTGTSGLYHVRLEDGEVTMLHRGVGAADVSPDGQWLAVLREAPATVAAGWYVYPVGRPDLAVPLVGVEGLAHGSILWGAAWSSETYLERLEILGPDTVMVGIPVRLRAQGVSPRGAPVPLHLLSWHATDTSVAAFGEGTEVLLPRAPGVVGIEASAGGWREAAEQVTVVPPAHEIVWAEDWSDGLDERWIAFGNPRPSVTEWPDGGHAFWNRGDGFYGSGVYSRDQFRWSRGLGLEAELSTPRTGPRAQRIGVGFHAWSDPAATEAWDHRTGGLAGATPACQFSYPAGDGAQHFAHAVVPGRRLELDPDVSSGEPFVVRVQIFPDGTCGVAVDGEPVFRGDLRTIEDTPNRIVLSGESLNSRILVGRVEVWEGMRDGVDWSALPWNPDSRSWN